MYVCVCNQVTDHQIRDAVEQGVDSLEQLSDSLKVATCCGRCRDCAKRLLNQARAERCMPDVSLAIAG